MDKIDNPKEGTDFLTRDLADEKFIKSVNFLEYYIRLEYTKKIIENFPYLIQNFFPYFFII